PALRLSLHLTSTSLTEQQEEDLINRLGLEPWQCRLRSPQKRGTALQLTQSAALGCQGGSAAQPTGAAGSYNARLPPPGCRRRYRKYLKRRRDQYRRLGEHLQELIQQLDGGTTPRPYHWRLRSPQ
ncbi:E4, partial [Equus caballus papillomavirus 1]